MAGRGAPNALAGRKAHVLLAKGHEPMPNLALIPPHAAQRYAAAAEVLVADGYSAAALRRHADVDSESAGFYLRLAEALDALPAVPAQRGGPS